MLANLDNVDLNPDYPANPSDPNGRILIRIIYFVDFDPSCGFSNLKEQILIQAVDFKIPSN